jgi:hypothetical protein
MEEIGIRTTVFSLEGVTGSQREYFAWLLASWAVDKVTVDDVLDPAAVDLLASRLRTPLQIEQHLTLALETGIFPFVDRTPAPLPFFWDELFAFRNLPTASGHASRLKMFRASPRPKERSPNSRRSAHDRGASNPRACAHSVRKLDFIGRAAEYVRAALCRKAVALLGEATACCDARAQAKR